MIRKWKISPHQFKLLVILSYIGTTILPTPGRLAFDSKQDAWISALIGMLFGLLLVLLYNSLGSKFGDRSIIQYSEKILGKWIGRLISILLFIYMLINCSTLIYILGNFIATQMMVESPVEIIISIFIIVIIIGTRLGLETFARLAEVLFPVVIGIFLLLVILSSWDLEFTNLQPIFETKIKHIFKGALLYTSYSSFTLLPLLIIFPACVNDVKEAKKSFLYGVLIGGIIMFIITILCILILGVDGTARSTYPSYVLAKKINIGNFFERLESVVTIMWFITIFFKTIIHFYGMAISLSQTFKLRDYKSLTIPLGIIVVLLSILGHPNIVYVNKWSTTTWLPYSLIFAVFIPVLLLIFSKYKNIENSKK